MVLSDEFDESFPSGLSEDISKQLRFALELLSAYLDSLSIADQCRDCDLSTALISPDVDRFEKNRKLLWHEPDKGNVIALDWLAEVEHVRNMYYGDFHPSLVLGLSWGIAPKPDSFSSAFAFVEYLVMSYMNVICGFEFDAVGARKLFCESHLPPPPTGILTEEELISAYDDALGLVLMLGCVSTLPLFEVSEVEDELCREAQAVEKSRTEGKSWYGPYRSNDSRHDTVDNRDLAKLTFRDLSVFNKLIVKTVHSEKAHDENTAINGESIAEKMKSPLDSRLRSELSHLRSQGWLGGAKGQRGYWLSNQALESLKSDCNDSVKD